MDGVAPMITDDDYDIAVGRTPSRHRLVPQHPLVGLIMQATWGELPARPGDPDYVAEVA